MIELPEASVIAAQIRSTLVGKQIAAGSQGNSPHKFAFITAPDEVYQKILPGKTILDAQPNGRMIRVMLDSGHILVLGEGGEQILVHTSEKTLPKKFQFWLRFTNEMQLTVSVAGWGATLLFEPGAIERHEFAGRTGISPLDAGFTFDYFLSLLAEFKPEDKASAKYFMITKPGVWGVGNGCLQDILFLAGLHPRHPVGALTADQQHRLFDATAGMLKQAAEQGGRDTEVDLFGKPGGYRKLLDARSAGAQCPKCRTLIEKENYLGGAVYFCPACQK